MNTRQNRYWIFISCLAGLLLVGLGYYFLFIELRRPSDFQKHLYQLRDDTRAQHRAADVKAAVLPMFLDNSIKSVPAAVVNLPIFSDDPTNIVTGFPLGLTNILSFTIGSGFGHWGIVVCRYEKDGELLTQDEWHKPRLTPWAEGVYFYSDYR